MFQNINPSVCIMNKLPTLNSVVLLTLGPKVIKCSFVLMELLGGMQTVDKASEARLLTFFAFLLHKQNLITHHTLRACHGHCTENEN